MSEKLIAELVDVIESAIHSGDWKVDGACDPEMILKSAIDYLEHNGWVRNSIDGHWQ